MTNWFRDLKRVYSQVTSPTMAATAGNYLHIAVPGMPNEGVVLKRLKITGNDLTTTASNELDIRLLNNGAAYREAEAAAAGSGEVYVSFAMNDEASADGPNTKYVSDTTFSDDVIYTDDVDSTTLHLRIDSPAALTGPTTFDVQVWGDGLPNVEGPPVDATPDGTPKKDLAIRRWSSGNVWKDLRDVRGDAEHRLRTPYPAYTLFSADTDYLYFGLEDEFDGLWFYLYSANTTAGTTATWEYWNGSTWSALTVRDNCTDANATIPTIFSYSGIIEWDEPADWAKTDLSSLSAPLDGPVKPYHAYGTFPTGDDGGSRISRYWVRLSLSTVTGQPTFKWVRSRPLV
jgi:hypothetical protein